MKTPNNCQKNEIELLCLPFHAFHILQPLDIGIFGPMKGYFRKKCDNYLGQANTNIFNTGKPIKRVIDKYIF